MNIALIFAGGSGKRMHSKSIPKQFLKLNEKEIIVYTIEHFEQCEQIDAIIVVCIESWIVYMNECLQKYALKKVKSVIPGGNTGQSSIYLGLKEAEKMATPHSIVLVHDGVRPLINNEIILDNIHSVRKNGSAITTTPAIETIVKLGDEDTISAIIERSDCQLARAPQSFFLDEILNAHECAINEKQKEFIDSASLMSYYGYTLFTVVGPSENIKITTPSDFFVFKAFYKLKGQSQTLYL